jgi:hypothetical protein
LPYDKIDRKSCDQLKAPSCSADWAKVKDPFILRWNSLPFSSQNKLNDKLMTYVGNGHLASTIFDKAIYLNGVYNGKRGVSHRARVPNIHYFFFNGSNAPFNDKKYELNMLDGRFLRNESFHLHAYIFIALILFLRLDF